LRVRVMVFNATFNNISAILWLSVLSVKETRVPGETTDLPVKRFILVANNLDIWLNMCIEKTKQKNLVFN
jgi:hypothetical protein